MIQKHDRASIARRGALGLLLVAVMAGCVPSSSSQNISWVAPKCPLDHSVVMYGGDSIAAHWPAFVLLPNGISAFSTARGGSAFGGNYRPDPTMDTIGDRVLAQLDACGDDVGVVAISGGVNDLVEGPSATVAIDAIRALDAELYRRGVPTVMLTIHPIAPNTDTARAIQPGRRAINAWMTTSGNLHAEVVDCTGALESAPGSDVLRSSFLTYENLLTVDPLHMNDSGYAAMAACARPAILDALR